MFNRIGINADNLLSKQRKLGKDFAESKFEFEFCCHPHSFEVENAEFRNFIPFGESEMRNQIKSVMDLNQITEHLDKTILKMPDNEEDWYLLTGSTSTGNIIRFKLIHDDYFDYCDLEDVVKFHVRGEIEIGFRVYAFIRDKKLIFLYLDPHHLIATSNRERYSVAKSCNMCISEI